MGAKNHQPCKKFLVNSTKLSRSLSVAYASLEKANVCLEDILLAELNSEPAIDIAGMLEELQLSVESLKEADKLCNAMRIKMNQENFSDLNSLYATNLEELGSKFVSKGLVAHDAWEKICEIMYDRGFYSVLKYFQMQIHDLLQKTQSAIQKVAELKELVFASQINLVLEENTEGNIKVDFFILYTLWNKFNQEFVASSVLSTELWYIEKDLGSLLETRTSVDRLVA